MNVPSRRGHEARAMTSYPHTAHDDATQSPTRRPSRSGVWRAHFAGRMAVAHDAASRACAPREVDAARCAAVATRAVGEGSRGILCAWRAGRCDDGLAQRRFVADVRGDAAALRGGHWAYDEGACALRWVTSGA